MPATKVSWMAGAVVDKTFELLGDYDGTGNVDGGDYLEWQYEFENPGSSDLSADGDDDGDVDMLDLDAYGAHEGNTLLLDAVE
jgi:hypothetical protein